MLIAKIEGNNVVEVADYRNLFPGVSFPAGGPDATWLSENSCMGVTMWKSFDRDIERLVSTAPYIEDNRVFTVDVEPLSEKELAANLAAKNQQIKKSIVDQTQARLDDFAKTRNYDGILSLATYATSTNPKFQAEGQYGVEARDTTWAKLYEILAEVEAGTRPMPEGYTDVEPELPVLEWPIA